MIQVRCYRDGEEAPVTLGVDAISVPVREATLLWIDAVEPDPAELDLLAARLGINPLTTEDLRNAHQRTKLEHYDRHFHVAIHDCDLADSRLVSREIDLVFGDRWLVSVRQPSDDPDQPSPFDVGPVEHRHALARSGAQGSDLGLLIWAFFDIVVDRYFEVGDRVDERLEDIEEIVFAGEGSMAIPRDVFDLRRDLVQWRRAAAPMREVVAQVVRREVEPVGDGSVVYFQDVYDHLLRVADLLESQRDLLTGLLEAELAVASNRMNLVMKRMTSWGAILLGSTLVAGIYGMNFRHIPELNWSFGYYYALGAMVVLTVGLYAWFKRKDWL